MTYTQTGGLMLCKSCLNKHLKRYQLISPTCCRRLFRIVAGALVAVVSICLLLILAEIICSARHKLKPAFYLGAGCLRALLSLVYFIIVVAGAAIAISTSGYALILSIVMLAASIGQVIYGSIIVHRVRKGVYSSVAQGDGSTAYNGSFTGRMQNDVEMRAGRDVMYR
jgi:hypothetical protein